MRGPFASLEMTILFNCAFLGALGVSAVVILKEQLWRNTQ
jgi:hypothetical protein